MKSFFKKLSLRDLLFAYNIGKKAWRIIRRKESPIEKIQPVSEIVWQIYEENKNREKDMESKLKSRKFWLTMVPAITMILGAFMAPEAVEHIKEILLGVLGLLGTYNIGQGMVDKAKVTAGK